MRFQPAPNPIPQMPLTSEQVQTRLLRPPIILSQRLPVGITDYRCFVRAIDPINVMQIIRHHRITFTSSLELAFVAAEDTHYPIHESRISALNAKHLIHVSDFLEFALRCFR